MKGGSKNNNKNNSSNIITEQINLFKKRKYFIDQKLFKLNKKIYG
jgi:hypothetical protein